MLQAEKELINMICAVYGCSNSYKNNVEEKTIIFYRFPKAPEISKKWVNACRRKDYINVKNARICCAHFKLYDYPDPSNMNYFTTVLQMLVNLNMMPYQHKIIMRKLQ